MSVSLPFNHVQVCCGSRCRLWISSWPPCESGGGGCVARTLLGWHRPGDGAPHGPNQKAALQVSALWPNPKSCPSKVSDQPYLKWCPSKVSYQPYLKSCPLRWGTSPTLKAALQR